MWKIKERKEATVTFFMGILFLWLPYTRHYKPRLVFLFTQFSLWLRLILQTIYVLKLEILHFLSSKSAAFKQERLQIESGLWWRAYGIEKQRILAFKEWKFWHLTGHLLSSGDLFLFSFYFCMWKVLEHNFWILWILNSPLEAKVSSIFTHN